MPTPASRLLGLVASALVVIVPAFAADPPPPTNLVATGTIKGRLVWAGSEIPRPELAVSENDARVKDTVCGARPIVTKDLVIDLASLGVEGAIAYLIQPTGDYSAAQKALLAKAPEVVIDLIQCEFVPYVSVVHKDQKLVFKSSDPVAHNVRFQAFKNGSVNAMLPPNGKMPVAITEAERRPIQLNCDIRPWMRGYFFVVDHPFAVVTRTDGSFSITGVPAGEQKLVVWQTSRGYVNDGRGKGMAVLVKPGATTDIGQIVLTK